MPGPGNRSRAHLTIIGQQPGTRGRASKWKPDLGEAVISLARCGKWPEEWAVELGVTLQTFQNWSKRYPEFREALELARVNLASYWLEYISANLTNPRLRITPLLNMLSRRLPKHFGPNTINVWDELGLNEPGGIELPFSDQVKHMTTEEIEARLDECRRQRGELG